MFLVFPQLGYERGSHGKLYKEVGRKEEKIVSLEKLGIDKLS